MMTAICKSCSQTVEVTIWGNRARLVSHKETEGSMNACEASLELVETHGRNYKGPDRVQELGKIKGKRGSSIGEKIQKVRDGLKRDKDLNPKLGNSKLPSWYESEAGF